MTGIGLFFDFLNFELHARKELSELPPGDLDDAFNSFNHAENWHLKAMVASSLFGLMHARKKRSLAAPLLG
jgi:hypothetical protein